MRKILNSVDIDTYNYAIDFIEKDHTKKDTYPDDIRSKIIILHLVNVAKSKGGFTFKDTEIKEDWDKLISGLF